MKNGDKVWFEDKEYTVVGQNPHNPELLVALDDRQQLTVLQREFVSQCVWAIRLAGSNCWYFLRKSFDPKVYYPVGSYLLNTQPGGSVFKVIEIALRKQSDCVLLPENFRKVTVYGNYD